MAGRRGRPRDAAARARILGAGAELFVRDGYPATTMTGLAAAAGVAVQTLYLAFSSKVGVLSAVHDVTLAGDDDPIPLLEREWARAAAQAPTIDQAWCTVVEHLPPTTVRIAPIYAAIQAASADPEVAELLTGLRAQRHRFSQELAARLLALPGACAQADTDRVADVLYAVICPETYALFVTERRWPLEQWRGWIRATVLGELTAVRGQSCAGAAVRDPGAESR